MQPKFSVIIPVFNSERHIEKCLNSILNQSLEAIEIIAVNDGSNDNTLEILNTMADRDRRLRVISQENAGPSVARNLGMNCANGMYISFVDADDWLERDAYECLEKKIELHNQPDVVMFNTFTNDSIKNRAFLSNKLYQKKDIEDHIYPRLIESLNRSQFTALRASVWLRVFKRTLVVGRIYFEKALRNNEDLVFCLSTTICAESFLYLGDAFLYHNCMTMGSASRGYMENSFDRMKPLFHILREAARSCNEYDFEAQIQLRVFRTFIFCCENEFHPDNKTSFISKYSFIFHLVRNQNIRGNLEKFNLPQEKSGKIYALCLSKKIVLPIFLLARYRMKNRINKLQYV